MPHKPVKALVANEKGDIFDLDGYAAVGMAGATMRPLTYSDTIRLPYGSELMLLPDRKPVLFDLHDQRLVTLEMNPYMPGEKIYPVAAFNSPGHVITFVSAHSRLKASRTLPLFSYGAVGWYKGGFRSAVRLVDSEKRQDLRYMKPNDVEKGIGRMRRRLPKNRLREHLERCARTYGCPAGKNFFLGRFEAPLPTARQCNARCLGCLSLQQSSDIPCSQQRIDFTPSPEEIAEVALAHLQSVKQAVVSFGQGCEGDPLLAADVIAPAVRLIRKNTGKGTINLNTNGGLPEAVEKIIDAGLDSMRVSINSLREACYNAYFRPNGFDFSDVLQSIDLALKRDRFVSINYLNMPGFTDTPEEYQAFVSFLRAYPIHMIQWRNLNFDPLAYYEHMQTAETSNPAFGMNMFIENIRKEFPKLKFGYFNPPKEKFGRVSDDGRQTTDDR